MFPFRTDCLADAIDPLFVTANHVEGVFWALLGLCCGMQAIRRRVQPTWHGWLAAGVLLAFGASDWVEAATGAWYDPWWLFAWKAARVVLLVGLGIVQWRRRRAGSRAER